MKKFSYHDTNKYIQYDREGGVQKKHFCTENECTVQHIRKTRGGGVK